MKILAIDTSAGPASCAVAEEGRLLASAFQNTRLTHSQTLLPMVESMLRGAALTLEEMDLLAVSAGPGFFTGLRIGMAAVKGMAFPGDKPCAAVSTLAAMARNLEGLPLEGLVCPVMDARCQQVYTALFECRDGVVTRQTPDEAISIEELKNRLISVKKSVIMVGDGANLCYNTLKDSVGTLRLAPPHLLYQQAAGVAAEAALLLREGRVTKAAELQPVYLRLPQAERELRRRQSAQRPEENGKFCR